MDQTGVDPELVVQLMEELQAVHKVGACRREVFAMYLHHAQIKEREGDVRFGARPAHDLQALVQGSVSRRPLTEHGPDAPEVPEDGGRVQLVPQLPVYLQALLHTRAYHRPIFEIVVGEAVYPERVEG